MHSLYAAQHAVCIAACKKNLSLFQKEGNMFINHTVTDDELCCYYHIPTSIDMEAQKFAKHNENKVKCLVQELMERNWKIFKFFFFVFQF